MTLPEQKSSVMYRLMLGISLILFVYFNPRFLALFIGKESISAKVFLLVFLIFLNIFLFSRVYYLVLYVFSSLRIRKVPLNKGACKVSPAIAFFYVTKNDFQKEPVTCCLEQEYSNFHVFILDDSTNEEYKRRIDDFSKGRNKITVLRRKEKHGFKAGNLNSGLKNLPKEYEFIAVIDADEVIPNNFLRELVDYFPANPDLAFVQARHAGNPHQKALFAADMMAATDIHWKYVVPSKNKYGFVMFYGHGALMRRAFVEEVGGFPEVVSEDISLSALLRQKGYYGYTDESVLCYEDTPEDYPRYRRRHEKWVRGTAEFFKKYLPGFIKCRNVPWFEKVDLLFFNASLFLPVFYFIFLLLCGAILPAFFAQKSALFISLPFLRDSFVVFPFYDMSYRLSPYWFWDIFLFILVSAAADVIPAFLELKKKPRIFCRYLKNSYVVWTGLIFVTFAGFFGGIYSDRSYFAATADAPDKTQAKGFFSTYVAERKSVFVFELLLGTILLFIYFLTFNPWLFPVSTSLIASYLVYRNSWDNKLVQYIMMIPFLSLNLILVIMVYQMLKQIFS